MEGRAVGKISWQTVALVSPEKDCFVVNYILDTSTIVHFLRGKEEAKNQIREVSALGALSISVITLGELLYGAYRSNNVERHQEKIFQFLTDFSISVLPLTSEIILVYAKAKYVLEKSGDKLDELDLLIGATTVASGSSLITGNTRHFHRFPGIVLVK